MVSPNVNRVLEETDRLSLDERRQLLALLSARDAQEHLTDSKLDGVLIGRGILLAPPPKPSAEEAARADAWQPVAIQGKPLSETVIEERR